MMLEFLVHAGSARQPVNAPREPVHRVTTLAIPSVKQMQTARTQRSPARRQSVVSSEPARLPRAARIFRPARVRAPASVRLARAIRTALEDIASTAPVTVLWGPALSHTPHIDPDEGLAAAAGALLLLPPLRRLSQPPESRQALV